MSNFPRLKVSYLSYRYQVCLSQRQHISNAALNLPLTSTGIGTKNTLYKNTGGKEDHVTLNSYEDITETTFPSRLQDMCLDGCFLFLSLPSVTLIKKDSPSWGPTFRGTPIPAFLQLNISRAFSSPLTAAFANCTRSLQATKRHLISNSLSSTEFSTFKKKDGDSVTWVTIHGKEIYPTTQQNHQTHSDLGFWY